MGEITTPGIGSLAQSLVQHADRETKDEIGGTLIGLATRAEQRAPLDQQAEVRQVRQELEEEYASWIPSEQTRREMDQLAQRYKELRQSMSAGTQRTIEMDSLAGRMRALAPRAALSSGDINDYLQSGDEGRRLLGLSILEWTGDVSHFNQVLPVVEGGSKSAFEQHHALRAMEKMLPSLNSTDKRRLREVLNKQREYDEAKKQWIRRGSDRWRLSERLLSVIGEV